MSLTTGLELLKQRQYAAAIPHLEALRQPTATGLSPSDRVRVLMGLVQAYAATERWADAIALCQTLTRHPHPKVQQWGKQRWRAIQRQIEQQQQAQTVADFAQVLPQAHTAIAQQDWATAIELLQGALDPATPTPQDPSPYQLLLIEAHLGNQDSTAAIALCKSLRNSSDPVVQAWVKQTLKKLQPPPPSLTRAATSLQERLPATASKPAKPKNSFTLRHLTQWCLLGISATMLWLLWSEFRLTLKLARLLPTPASQPGEVVKGPIVGGLNTARAFPAPYTARVSPTVINQALAQLNRNHTPSQVALNESEQYYDIQGQTAYQLWEAIGQEAQYIVNSGGQGTHAIASAALKPSWNFTTQRTQSHCWISDVNIKMEVQYTYPRWSNAEAGSAELWSAWEQYRQFLIRHEQGHTQIAVEALSGVEAAILALGARSDCTAIVQAARQLAAERWQASSQTQTDYDKNEDDPDQYILRSLAVQERYREQEAWSRGF